MHYTDSLGLYAGIDALVFSGGGAVVRLIGQGISDYFNGQLSSWQDYAGAALGDAVGGEALLYTGRSPQDWRVAQLQMPPNSC